MLYRRKRHAKVLSKEQAKFRAKDLVYKKMIFYYERSEDIYKRIEAFISVDNPTHAAKLLIELGKTDDKFAKYSSLILPYEAPKLASIEVKKKVTKRYVIVAPKIIPNAKNWLKAVETDKLALPPPVVPQQIQQEAPIKEIELDQDQDQEIEYMNGKAPPNAYR